MGRVYRTMTSQSIKVIMDPLDLDVREMLTEDEICELEQGTEIEDTYSQSSVFSQITVSTLGASMTLGHARAFVERSTLQLKQLREHVCGRIVKPMTSYGDGTFKTVLKDATKLK